MGLGNESNHLLSNIAVNGKHGENSAYFDGWKAYERDPFHPTNNPQGVVQMGLAENQLCFDLIEEWMRNHPEASICTPEGLHNFRDIAIFQDYHGLPQFRKCGVANFMSKVRGGRVKFDEDRIVMSGGATGANELVMFCLADPGDAFLVPAPYYPAFTRDLCWRTRVQIIPVHCDSSNNFKITRDALEAAYKKAQEDKVNVKGLLITNPSNPLGTTLDRETLESLVKFINENNIHLVCDEIYAATVFNSSNFVSVSEIIQDMELCNKDLIHVVYSLSKDMGLPGFRVGIVYSYNDTVVNRGRKMSSFGLVSSQTQYMLASMLSDDDFVEKFLAESSRRLAKRHSVFKNGLEKMGIACLPSNAGLFCWMNLRSMLKEQTIEGEMMLWRMIVNDVKLNVSPGSSFTCLEPGWFRVCFANMDNETVDVALKRIKDFVGKEIKKSVKVKHSQGLNLRVSFSSRRFDETVLSSPHMISPHSPIPHSPLVKAT
ncbi:LOW QUALITY PROTEIN: 1-aminocyclopropane-1-carboxylate synthase 1-like [Prosopis cineraria]|uniref:LOW QUALITY PROTEIN: 1-aminocyclopropane-1-carboxylate synthase 1-like n=1 Tax=Prosopis cineraria TaxID=364024 RepID=UPI0024108F9E|nr:LOW QUALITY PROTEIN: 1-aminocyclopropane-1-carboxylate synthase 1-like [Prosopis cineraria]